jgi:hypothetical protein
MEREIKFRGKSVNGDWYYGLLSHSTGAKGHTVPEGWYISNKSGMPWAYQVRPETIGQFTGSWDDDGKEIYQDDVLQIHDPEKDSGLGPNYQYESVYYQNGAFALEWDYGEYDITAIGWAKEYFSGNDITIKVVGNLYDNPEFVEKLEK